MPDGSNAMQAAAEGPGSGGGGATDAPREGISSVVETESEALLLQITDDLALVLGPRVPDILDVLPVPEMAAARWRDLTEAVGPGLGALNLGAQAASGAYTARGLVRLAPETLQMLKSATPLRSGGWNLGVLQQSGKVVGQIRWLPAGAAGLAAAAPALTAAATLIAIQVQVERLAKDLTRNLELTRSTLARVRQEQWSSIQGQYQILARELAHAQALGSVTGGIFAEVKGSAASIEAYYNLFLGEVRSHEMQIRSRGKREVGRYLAEYHEAILADVHGLLLAHASRLIYQTMRASFLLGGARSEEQTRLAERVMGDVRSLQSEGLQSIDRVLDLLSRELVVQESISSTRRWLGKRRTLTEGDLCISRQLRESLDTYRDTRGAMADPFGEVEISLLRKPLPPTAEAVLRQRMSPDARVIAMASVSYEDHPTRKKGEGWVIVTDRHILVVDERSLLRDGRIQRVIHRTAVDLVHRPPSQKSPVWEIRTGAGSVTITLDRAMKGAAPVPIQRRLTEMMTLHPPALETDVHPEASAVSDEAESGDSTSTTPTTFEPTT